MNVPLIATKICKYYPAGCEENATFYCTECNKWYCKEHSGRHNRLILENFKELEVDTKYAILAVER